MHADARTVEETDWSQIVALYDWVVGSGGTDFGEVATVPMRTLPEEVSCLEIPDDFQPTPYGVQWMDGVGDMHPVPWSATDAHAYAARSSRHRPDLRHVDESAIHRPDVVGGSAPWLRQRGPATRGYAQCDPERLKTVPLLPRALPERCEVELPQPIIGARQLVEEPPEEPLTLDAEAEQLDLLKARHGGARAENGRQVLEPREKFGAEGPSLFDRVRLGPDPSHHTL